MDLGPCAACFSPLDVGPMLQAGTGQGVQE